MDSDNHRPDLYQNARIKNAYYNTPKKIGPGGGPPWFGDCGGVQNANALLIASFERAATVYYRGHFKWAAHRMYQASKLGAY